LIIVRLMGGLGNQMFQYAAGRRLAKYNHTDLLLDTSWFDKFQNPDAPALRHYELDCFAFSAKIASRKDLARIDTPPHTKKRRIIRKVYGPVAFYKQSDFMEYHPEVLKAPDNSYLEGFWQSELYFKDATKEILKDFRFKSPLSGKNLELANQFKSRVAVSLHVRRGDYVSHPVMTATHGLSSLQYYQAAVDKIVQKVKSPHFYVISDDPAWSKKNIKVNYPVTYIDHNRDGSKDLHLMSLCKHHITANSSFSWWGAWLNPSKEKIVISPRNWFVDPKMNHKEVIPEQWIKL
jgi:hypothetical protein